MSIQIQIWGLKSLTCADMLTSRNAGLYVSSLVDRLAGIRKHGHDPSYTTQKNLAVAFDPYSADMYNCDTHVIFLISVWAYIGWIKICNNNED